ncbi:hypothetical protein CEXT_42141 [Caerostris extrusa]|uniref:Uncharacterized protein n=1 Tax=Caerostris extrusa TaxID=172846 RepID=A0AAV4SAE7_CAEEX|nr:hypothetical protein CEXT_42141 [Caerostris extrusa]
MAQRTRTSAEWKNLPRRRGASRPDSQRRVRRSRCLADHLEEFNSPTKSTTRQSGGKFGRDVNPKEDVIGWERRFCREEKKHKKVKTLLLGLCFVRSFFCANFCHVQQFCALSCCHCQATSLQQKVGRFAKK